MLIELDHQDIETLLESLKFSKQRVSDAQGTPESVRNETLARIDVVAEKIRAARRAS